MNKKIEFLMLKFLLENEVKNKNKIIFKEEKLNLILKKIIELEKKKIKPDILILKNEFKENEEIIKILKSLKKIKIENNRVNYLRNLINTKIKKEILKETIYQIYDRIEKNKIDYDEIINLLKENILLVSNRENEIQYFNEDLLKKYLTEQEYKIATGINKLNEILNGGLSAGELGLLIAPSNMGKSHFLIDLGVFAILQGKKVIHLTLEMSEKKVAERYDRRLLKKSKKEILNNIKVLKKVKHYKKMGGDLIIKYYPTSSIKVSEFKEYLMDLKDLRGYNFDIIIVDYADLFKSGVSGEYRHKLAGIFKELRGLAGEFNVPVWTATQSVRSAYMKKKIDSRDVSESIEKINISDVVITMSQTEEERNDNVVRLFIDKNRDGERGAEILLKTNFTYGLFEEIEEEEVLI